MIFIWDFPFVTFIMKTLTKWNASEMKQKYNLLNYICIEYNHEYKV